MQRCTVFSRKGVAATQRTGGGEYIGANDIIAQASELGIGKRDFVQRLEFGAEVLLQRSAVTDIGAVGVFKLGELSYQILFDLYFFGHTIFPI